MSNTFIKLMSPKMVQQYLKEARRVGYIIEKDDMYCRSFKVLDDETNVLVFKGIRMNRSFYAVTFNKMYWVEPDRTTSYSASMMEEVR